MRRRLLEVAVLAATVAAVPASAAADGLPVLGVDVGPTGVTSERSAFRYVTLNATRETVVARVRRDGGKVVRTGLVRGLFTVPAVALDGSASGLSADGSTLVLIKPRAAFPRAQTPFVVLDARRLRARGRFTLRGDFSFDALSPDGASMYLIQYLSRTDPTRYAVRAFDVRAGRLLREPIVDPSEPGEPMRGYPITRATSAGGRWEYTLYDGAGSHPFVHALDTVGREAVCIDLDMLAGRSDLYELGLDLGGGGRNLVVRGSDAATLAMVDLATHRASAVRPRPARAPERSSGGPAAWTVLVAIAAALLIGGGMALVARRRAASVPEMPTVREHHRDAGGVGGLDDLVVALGTAGLDDRGDARARGDLDAVGEWEVRVRRHDREARVLAGLANGDLDRHDA
jgi:hypothetical protein